MSSIHPNWLLALVSFAIFLVGCGAGEEPVVNEGAATAEFAAWPLGDYTPVLEDSFRTDYLERHGGDSEAVREEIVAYLDELEDQLEEFRMTISEDGSFTLTQNRPLPTMDGEQSAELRPSITLTGRWILDGEQMLLMVDSPSPRYNDPDTDMELWPPLLLIADEDEGTLIFLDEDVWPVGSPVLKRTS